MKQAIELYISSLSTKGYSKQTIRQYTTFLNNFDTYLSGKVFNRCYDLAEIETKHVQKYLKYLKNVLRNSDATRNNKLTCIRCFLEYLVDLEYVNRNVAKEIYIKVSKKTTQNVLVEDKTTKNYPLLFSLFKGAKQILIFLIYLGNLMSIAELIITVLEKFF